MFKRRRIKKGFMLNLWGIHQLLHIGKIPQKIIHSLFYFLHPKSFLYPFIWTTVLIQREGCQRLNKSVFRRRASIFRLQLHIVLTSVSIFYLFLCLSHLKHSKIIIEWFKQKMGYTLESATTLKWRLKWRWRYVTINVKNALAWIVESKKIWISVNSR